MNSRLFLFIGLIFLCGQIFTADFFNRTDNITQEYNLEKYVERGGFGTVVKGIHRETEKTVAIKIIQVPKNQQRALNNEIILLRYIKAMGGHPNIVNLIDSFFDAKNHILYIILDFLEGGDMIKYFDNKPPFTNELVAKLTPQLVSALGFLKQLGIAHQDIKPDNIIVTKNNDGAIRLVIVDFGSAKLFNNKLYRQNSRQGTVGYIPAESLRCLENQDLSKRDPFAMGVLLYAMLSGYLPWHCRPNSPSSIKKAILLGNYEPLSTEGKEDIYEKLAGYIHNLISIDPSQRILENTSLNLRANEHLLPPTQKASNLNIDALKFLFYYHSQDRSGFPIDDMITAILEGEEQYLTRFYEFLCKYYPNSPLWNVQNLEQQAKETEAGLPQFILKLLSPELLKLSESVQEQ